VELTGRHYDELDEKMLARTSLRTDKGSEYELC